MSKRRRKMNWVEIVAISLEQTKKIYIYKISLHNEIRDVTYTSRDRSVDEDTSIKKSIYPYS